MTAIYGRLCYVLDKFYRTYARETDQRCIEMASWSILFEIPISDQNFFIEDDPVLHEAYKMSEAWSSYWDKEKEKGAMIKQETTE